LKSIQDQLLTEHKCVNE